MHLAQVDLESEVISFWLLLQAEPRGSAHSPSHPATARLSLWRLISGWSVQFC